MPVNFRRNCFSFFAKKRLLHQKQKRNECNAIFLRIQKTELELKADVKLRPFDIYLNEACIKCQIYANTIFTFQATASFTIFIDSWRNKIIFF